MVVSRWFVRPIAAMAPAFARADARAARVAASTLDQMASGSCSTQPGFGKCCGSSA
jgi:hypothetical protein